MKLIINTRKLYTLNIKANCNINFQISNYAFCCCTISFTLQHFTCSYHNCNCMELYYALKKF